MRSKMVLILLLLCVLLVFGCNKAVYSNNLLSFSFDGSGNYTGFSDLSSNYTIEDAKTDGYYATQGLEVVANKNVWDSFVETSLSNKNTSIRIVSFHTKNANSPFLKDLFYRDGYYYCFDSSAENQEKHPYLYLLTLEGQFGNPLKDSVIIILTDDNTLTFDIVMQSALSSDINYKKSISSYKLIMIKGKGKPRENQGDRNLGLEYKKIRYLDYLNSLNNYFLHFT